MRATRESSPGKGVNTLASDTNLDWNFENGQKPISDPKSGISDWTPHNAAEGGGPIYTIAAAACALTLAFALKAFYSRASVAELLWILAPSAWLAQFLGGIDLTYEQGAGFISHTHHLVVGSACAGINFLVICFLCLYFSFARHNASKTRWLLLSLLISFGATIAANSLRIFVSAHLWSADFYRQWITQENMHRLAGTGIYYASLLSFYCAVESRIGMHAPRSAPLFWYLGISLGVPLAGRLVAVGTPGLAGHAAWVIAVALLLTLVKVLPSVLRNRIHLRP